MDANAEARAILERSGLPAPAVADWLANEPKIGGDYSDDALAHMRFWRAGEELVSRLPRKSERSEPTRQAGAVLHRILRASRDRFLATHMETLYRGITHELKNFVRVERIAHAAAELLPGLVPTADQVAAEAQLLQRDKEGREIDQGLLFSRILAHPVTGAHLCHAMLLPRAEAVERLPVLRERGAIDLGAARVERRGKASHVTMSNPRFLNAEDEGTIDAVETAIDLALLDPGTEVCVLRGDVVEHPKYRGKHVFSTGINLTHLYHGKISYLWYVKREMGFVNKMYRGLASPDASPDEICGDLSEKLWIAGVDAFAIGGGCQYLLALDYVVAASDAYMTLPARKEGIIPGAANMRLPRFTGDRIARQAIQHGRRINCDTPEGRLICDEITTSETMDRTLDRVVEDLTGSGVVSAAANRRAFRVTQEPLDLFRRYMSVYAREQAFCHFSPALIANLERHWNAAERKP